MPLRLNSVDVYRIRHPRSRLESREWLIPLTPGDQHLVGGGLEGEAEPEEPVEGGVRGAPAVEPEHELVQVGLEVLLERSPW